MKVTIKLLLDRCEQVGECLHWAQGVNGNGQPIISLSSKQRSRSVRPLAWSAYHDDMEVPAGLFAVPRCGHKLCLADGCLRLVTRSQYMLQASKAGAYSKPSPGRARVAQEKSPLDWDKVRAIRADRVEGKLLEDIAPKHGVSIGCVSRVVRNEVWREVAPAASIFAGALA